MERRQLGNTFTGVVIERFKGSANVGPPGSRSVAGHDLGREHSALGLHRHVRAVVVPTLVASQTLHHVIVRIGDERTIAGDVGDSGSAEFQCTETQRERSLLLASQELAREDQQTQLDPRCVDRTETRVVQCRLRHASDSGAERGFQRIDIEHRRPHASNLAETDWGPNDQTRLTRRPDCHGR